MGTQEHWLARRKGPPGVCWDESFPKFCFLKSCSRYQGLPRNIHRHVIISEHKEALSHLPPELKEANVVVSGMENKHILILCL